MTAVATRSTPISLSDPGLPAQGEWTYEDYRRLPDDGWRYEVMEGVLHMTPAPKPNHQFIFRNLALALGNFLLEFPIGELAFAPIDVVLPGDLAAPVQPDLIFLRTERLGLIGEDNIQGAPDLIVEILSPSNWIQDRRDQFRIYSEAGVPEYWIIDPQQTTVEVSSLIAGTYEQLGSFSPGEALVSRVLPDFKLSLAELFPS